MSTICILYLTSATYFSVLFSYHILLIHKNISYFLIGKILEHLASSYLLCVYHCIGCLIYWKVQKDPFQCGSGKTNWVLRFIHMLLKAMLQIATWCFELYNCYRKFVFFKIPPTSYIVWYGSTMQLNFLSTSLALWVALLFGLFIVANYRS